MILFYILAGIVMAGAGVVCFAARDVLRSAVGLVFVLAGVAGLYFMLHAAFLAVVQLVVYVGGMLAVLLVGMVLGRKAGAAAGPRGWEIGRALVLAGVIAGPLVVLFMNVSWKVREAGAGEVPVEDLGVALVSSNGYLAAFELMAVILVSVMIGAAYMARTRRPVEPPEMAPYRQVTKPVMGRST